MEFQKGKLKTELSHKDQDSHDILLLPERSQGKASHQAQGELKQNLILVKYTWQKGRNKSGKSKKEKVSKIWQSHNY